MRVKERKPEVKFSKILCSSASNVPRNEGAALFFEPRPPVRDRSSIDEHVFHIRKAPETRALEDDILILQRIRSDGARSRRNSRQAGELGEKDLSLYIVHCNYNLYLLVIDTFIGRLLQLVASVSQAQI